MVEAKWGGRHFKYLENSSLDDLPQHGSCLYLLFATSTGDLINSVHSSVTVTIVTSYFFMLHNQ